MVDWTFARQAPGTRSMVPRYDMEWGHTAAPPVVTDLLVTQLQSAAPGQDHAARLAQIAQVVLARVGARTWHSYASHFASFVRFCVSEGLEFMPGSQYAGLLWAQSLAARGTVQARTAQPYFSAVNTVHELLGFPKPCCGDNLLLAAFRKGWERLQVSITPAATLVLAFRASDVWRLYDVLPTVGAASELFVPLLFVLLGFCVFLRPVSLLSVQWARVVDVDDTSVFQYKPLNWKGRIVQPAVAPVLQFPLCGLPCLRAALLQQLARTPGQLWPARQSTRGAEQWFRLVLERCGLPHLTGVHTLYSLRRGGASAARAVGVPLEVIESFGGWSAGSAALRAHYLDMGVPGCVSARAVFGPLAAQRVAPFAVQFFNR